MSFSEVLPLLVICIKVFLCGIQYCRHFFNKSSHLAASYNRGDDSVEFFWGLQVEHFALMFQYRCEIINEEDAGLALQASNYINKKILEFNTASRWNRKTQVRSMERASELVQCTFGVSQNWKPQTLVSIFTRTSPLLLSQQ